jgi:hypothetical protein
MSIADDVEKYGRAVDAGQTTSDEAAILLCRQGYSLTHIGAKDLIENWASVHARYSDAPDRSGSLHEWINPGIATQRHE